jgi:hypothetical protein
MNEQTFHAEVWLPEGVAVRARSFAKNVRYTKHALEQAQQDRYAKIVGLPGFVDVSQWSVLEATLVGNEVAKVVIRRPSTARMDLDLVLAVRFDNSDARVVTCWHNRSNDRHHSLNRANYVQAPKI